MKIALRALSLRSAFLDSSESSLNFSTTAFHNPCSVRADFILIFQRLKLVPPSNFGTSYFTDKTDIVFDAIMSQIMHSQTSRSSSHLADRFYTSVPVASHSKASPKTPSDRMNLNQSTEACISRLVASLLRW